MIYEIRHERKKSENSNAIKFKQRQSEEVQVINQINQSDRLNSIHSQLKQSINISDRSSYMGIENRLLPQDSVSEQEHQQKRHSLEGFQNKFDIEQPIPLIQLIEHEARDRCKVDIVKQMKCQGDLNEFQRKPQVEPAILDVDQDIIRKHEKHSQRNYRTDPYYVKLVELHGHQRIKHELEHYHDPYPLLQVRKIIVYMSFLIPIVAKTIVNSIGFQILMTILILFNIALYIIVKTEHREDTDQIEQIITILFFTEIGLRILSQGFLFSKNAYFINFSNVFDFSIVLLSALNLYRPDIMIIDLSPLRIITLLQYLGDIFDGLRVMLTALRQSIKYILEALAIVGLFSLFFALAGLYLFQGLFNYRCMPTNPDEDAGDDWIQCNVDQCPDEMTCQYVANTVKVPTSFNNIIYSYGQILRTITMDDWSWVMFFTIRIFSPWVWIYYLLIIFVGGFFGFNLVIAVLKTHYAEAAEEFLQQQEQQEINKQLLEQQNYNETQIRDTTNVFDVALLKKIEFHKTFSQYYKLLNSSKQLSSYKLENFQSKNSTQPRLLSAKQRNVNDNNMNFIQSSLQKLRGLTFKNVLLIKFSRLRKQQSLINLKNYTDDEDYLKILEDLMKFDFAQLSKQLNPNQYQKYSSLEDVLPSFANIQNMKKHIDDKVIDFSKYTFSFQYAIPQLNQLQDQLLKSNNTQNSFKYPLKKSFRVQKHIIKENGSQDSVITRKPCIRTEKKNYKGFTKHMVRSKHTVQFVLKKGEVVTFLFIQGYYLNYDKILFKIKQKIEKEKIKQQCLEQEYKNIRMKDIKNKIISDQNWSGNDVIDQNDISINFRSTLIAMNKVDQVIWVRGIIGKILILKKQVSRMVSSKITEIALDLLIFVNFTFLSLYGIVDASIISQVEDITTILLSIETFLRYCSFSFKELSNSNESIMQTMIVILNFIEFTMSDYMPNLTEQNLRLIRGTKCILFYRCLKYNSMAVTIGHIASKTFKQYIYLTFLMFIVIFLYALVGMEVYAGRFDQSDVLGQLHSYNNVLKSFMTVFNIMTNDDWYGVFILGTGINETFAVVYSYSMVIVLNYLTYGLVLAILLDGFGKYLDRQIFSEMEENEPSKLVIQNTEQQETQQTQQFSEINNMRSLQNVPLQKTNSKQKIALIQHLINSIRQIYQKIQDENPELYNGVNCEQSLFCFDKTNHLRKLCMLVARSKLYILINDLSLVSSIVIFIIQTYNDYEENKETYPQVAQFYINLILAIDYAINVIAKGLFIDNGAYFNSIWQILDVIYIIAFFIQYEKDDYVKPIFQIFLYVGYFRPLNLLNRITILNVLSSALYKSLVDILNVLLTLFSVWIIFGVYGIILYERQFGFCEDKMEFRVSYQECIEQNRTWVNFKHNFDNITMAIPTLFTVSTFDGWGEMLQIAENSDNANVGPVPFNSYIHTYVFFISFCFVGSMFFLSLFTGVLFSNLKVNQRKIEKKDFNQNQKEFIEISDIITKDIPVFSTPPDNVIRRFASIIMNDNIMQTIFFIVLLLDLVNNILFHSDMTTKHLIIINYIHHGFSITITIWGLIQYLALGLFRFFDNYWRQFLFILILFAITDLVIDFEFSWVEFAFNSSPLTPYYRLYRICFMLRSLRLILIFQGLINIQRLMRVMVYALPFLGKIFFILIDTMLVFALFGCQLYGQIDSGQVMDEQINFHNIAQAMLTLFKCASGDDWRTIMTDTMHHNPNCTNDSTYCGSTYSQIYFFLFMLLSNYVFLNLFVLGLIEQFESFFQVQNSIIQTYVENEDRIKTIWCKYSPETQGKAMHYKFLCRFLMDLGAPLGRGKEENLWDAAKQASAFKLKCDHRGYIQYNQLIYELFRTCFQEDVFKTGSKNGIKQIKQYNKEMQMKLMNYRRNLFIKRANICLVDLRTNFNILHDYLNVLIAFKAWESHSKKLIKRVNFKNREYTENMDSSKEEQNDDELQQSENSILNDMNQLRGSIQISDTDRFQPMITDENQTKHLLTSLSQESMQAPQLPCYNHQLPQKSKNLFIYQPKRS
ncbi:unnamed protein product (macronuclear) [Paramecium tetraurelia]|uniref:Ion transport domain-containing protein n=1 Tax=Paramecium tetraurelia TaxID=5888 RepID=A0DI39_PARTE|nr:uncharacterized protein GSPATT00017077001 [Paramecium tetraurelia]CAK82706.1 unnamed protein product [Paramecium tetraurelia]|eukprot:XP_001450103.1 hypothetical protein (macronuclear) [Paramecium tetraurelia strain d4-2]